MDFNMENKNKHNYKRPIDEYLPCEDYKGDDGFIKFFREDEKRYYFAYNGNSGKTYLRSQGYQNEPGRDNGIDSVIRNAKLDERWQTNKTEDGKLFYYSLKAGNRQEIARSCYYESEEEMQTALAWVRGEESTIGKGSKEIDGVWWSAAALKRKQEEEAAPKSKEEARAPIDDYLPCQDYSGEEGFYKFYRDDRKEYYFSLNNDKGKTYLRSEGYTSEAARNNGIESVIKNAQIDERWTTGTAVDDKYHYYALKAGNHQEIARSCYYKNKDEMLADLAWVKGENSIIGKGSKIVDGVLISAAMLLSKNKTVSEVKSLDESNTEPQTPASAEPIIEKEIPKKEEKETYNPVAATAVTDETSKAGCGRWWPWLLLLAAIIILCLIFCRGCNDKVSNAVTDTSAKVESVTNTVSETTGKIAEQVGKATDNVAEKVSEAAAKTVEATSAAANELKEILKPGDSFVLEGLNFVFNKDVLTENSKVILNKAVVSLKKYSTLKVEIQGYTDNKGNNDYNKMLSQKRAIAIMKYLISQGIDPSRLKAVGYGESHPIASNSTDKGRAKNRRVEFKILEK